MQPRFDPSGRFAASPGTAAPAGAASVATRSPTSAPRVRVDATSGEAAPEDAVSGSGEQVWERTHLEQTMFQLAREHAEAAARSARLSPPDRPGEQTHSLVAVLMSYFALEAFINMAGADRLGDRFHHYDRMTPEGKWVEVTRLVSKTGKTFPEEGSEVRSLSALRTWRNTLTHYKGEYEDVQQSGRGGETRIEALLSAENAARAVEIARSLHRAFYELDRRSPPRQFIWLDDRPHLPGEKNAPDTSPRRTAASPSPGAVSRKPVPPAASAAPAPGPAPAAGPEEGAAARPSRRRRRRRR